MNLITNADSLPVLERLMQFAAARHRLIASNIANFDTPGYQPTDLSVDAFHEALGQAIDVRRSRHGASGGDLDLDAGSAAEGGLTPEPIHENILFHDRNERDLERTMQAMVENFTSFRFAAQMLRTRFDVINTAIRERL